MKMGLGHWRNSTDGGNRSIRRVSLCPPQISLGLIWDRTRASKVREWQLTFSATEGGTIYWKCIGRFNSYLAVNTFHLGLKSWLTMYEAVIAVFVRYVGKLYRENEELLGAFVTLRETPYVYI